MNADFFYGSACGRICLKILQRTGAFRAAAYFLHAGISRKLIARYIRKNRIDMSRFAEQEYRSFAEFFSRKAENVHYNGDPDTLISPCDGLLSVYPVDEEMCIPMKGSRYVLSDLIPDAAIASQFRNGICLVFRLEASDYHHFCSVDDMTVAETHYIPGLLHSVQPIACRSVPVYRLNRRWWSVLSTSRFETAVQIEVGAMAVGGVTFAKEKGDLSRGEEMGNFELAGSTIILILNEAVRERLEFFRRFREADGEHEVRVAIGEGIGEIGNGR